MVRKAIKERWPITAAQRKKLVKELAAIINDPDAKERAKVAAAKVLLEADLINIKEEKQVDIQSSRARFLAVAERLGIGERFTGAESGSTASNIVTIDAKPTSK